MATVQKWDRHHGQDESRPKTLHRRMDGRCWGKNLIWRHGAHQSNQTAGRRFLPRSGGTFKSMSATLGPPGKAVEIGPGVRRLLAPNAGMMTGPGTNTYLLGTTDVAIIDPGPDDAAHHRAITAAIAGRLRWILVTHTHRDHSPLAAPLAAATGAMLIGLPPPADGRQDDGFRADHRPRDGERLALGDMLLTAIHTPGHASNCVCYLQETGRMLFTGDHVLEGVSPVILPPDGDMTAYLDSLAKLEAHDFEHIAPGHGGLLASGRRMVQLLLAHRLARERKVLARLEAAGPVSLDALTPAVYDDVPPDRHVWARLTLEAHLIKLERDGRVVQHMGSWHLLA
jgi:glyoxylase-like metal-dependent hydrolase (beta-lactamase superfamily II)